ncbi:MAG TPA: D-glycero-beta-D-manno-heptose 1-phosphate adenylyltransferase [Candidatus Omnitrophota bacterium]|nr:D-glycero-beta-D-manno-heptose 1-phosphate adenylyltransferase [Candidatus Omnitrophota bacterium]
MSKIKSLSELKRELKRSGRHGLKIVFTNGCFDILHLGHIDYLERAKKLGDILVVGLNSDGSVKKLKGPSRPINSQKARARMLAALESVDFVTIFNEETPAKVIKNLCPDVLVKGGDWKPKDIVGSDFVTSAGGRVVSLKFVKGYSTTGLLKKMASS